MIKTIAVLAYLLGGAETHQIPMELSSAVVKPGGKIPITYTCNGNNVSIPLRWQHVPSGTRSLALIMFDKTTPQKQRYLWAVYNISPKRHWLKPVVKLFRGEQYAANSRGHFSYDGPCPPQGEEHRYVIRLYALRAHFYFHQKATAPELLQAMQHRIIATAELNVRFVSSKKMTHRKVSSQ